MTNWLQLRLTAPALMAMLALTAPAGAATYTVLHGFTGGPDGAYPHGDLAIDSAGAIYGTAEQGGTNCTSAASPTGFGCGVLWKVDGSGAFSTLHSFVGTDGAVPNDATLVTGKLLLGLTLGGGTNDDGVAYTVRTDGTHFKAFYSFGGAHSCAISKVTFDAAGNGYATDLCDTAGVSEITKFIHGNGDAYTGGVFATSPAGTTFERVVAGPDGTLYTVEANTTTCTAGASVTSCGTLISISPDGRTITALADLSSTLIGRLASPNIYSKNVIYGRAVYGSTDNWGSVWSYDLATKKLKLHVITNDELRFPTYQALAPHHVVWGASFYGSSNSGPNAGLGTIWSEAPNGTLTVHYVVSSNPDPSGGYAYATPAVGAKTGGVFGAWVFGGVSSPPSYNPPSPGQCSRPDGTLITVYGCGTIYSFVP